MSSEYGPNDETSLMVKHPIVVTRSTHPNIVDDIYEIQINNPLPDLNTEFSKYYLAINTQDKSEYFAVVCERSFNVQISLLDKLKNYSADNGFINLLAYGVVKISSDNIYKVVAIINKYDYNATLANHLIKNGSLDSTVITQSLVPMLSKVLQFCANHEICCGNINTKNILMLEDGAFCLREFFSSPSHFYQDKAYLAPEISDCINYARETTSVAADIYASGITVHSAYTGSDPLPDITNAENYNVNRLENGTFFLIMQKKRYNSSLSTFIKGTLQDNVEHRWGSRQIVDWLSGSAVKPIVGVQDIPRGYTLSFNGSTYDSLNALAASMHSHPTEALQFIDSDGFQKWIQRNIDTNNIAVILSQFLPRSSQKRSDQSNQEALFKAISALEHSGESIKIDNICLACDAIPQFLFYSVNTMRRQWCDSLMSALINKWWGEFVTASPYGSLRHGFINLLLKLISTYTPNTAVYGVERLMYVLNPYAPCQSSHIADQYVITLPECLTALEKIAERHPDHIIIDWHLVAFLASRVGVKAANKAQNLKDFPGISNSLINHLTHLLYTANLMQPNIKLNNLSNVIGQRLVELIEKNVHNIKLTKVLSDRLTEAGKDCNFLEMIDVLSNTKIFHNDYMGYKKACIDVAELNKTILSLSDVGPIQNLGEFFGQRVTVFTAYILCFIVVSTLIV